MESSEVKTLSDGGKPEEKLDPAQTIPDGGLQAWLSVAGGWLVTFCTFGYANSFGVYQDYYTLVGTSTASDISWIGSLQLFFTFFISLPAGRLFDAGYFRHITVFGSLLYCFSLFMLSLANPQKYYQLILSQGVGMGIGAGLLLAPAQAVQSHYWRKRRSLALGIMMTGTSIGGVVFPIMLNQLIHGSAGFAWGVRATAFLTLGMLFIANCLMRTRLPAGKGSNPRSSTFRTILADKRFLVFTLGQFLAVWGVYFPYFYLQLWVTLHSLSGTLAFYTIAILNAASIPPRVVLNSLADRFGVLNTQIPTMFVSGALVFALFGCLSNGSVIVFSILYGLFSGAYVALIAPGVASLSPSVDQIGSRLGFVYGVSSFAFLTGTPITGALLGTHATWYKPILFSACVVLSGAVAVTVARGVYARQKGAWRL